MVSCVWCTLACDNSIGVLCSDVIITRVYVLYLVMHDVMFGYTCGRNDVIEKLGCVHYLPAWMFGCNVN